MFSAITGYLILEPERLLKAGSRLCRNSANWQMPPIANNRGRNEKQPLNCSL
jgi:hypothetical protein